MLFVSQKDLKSLIDMNRQKKNLFIHNGRLNKRIGLIKHKHTVCLCILNIRSFHCLCVINSNFVCADIFADYIDRVLVCELQIQVESSLKSCCHVMIISFAHDFETGLTLLNNPFAFVLKRVPTILYTK